MFVIASLLVAAVAALHLYFLVLEMFLWTKPQGLKTFKLEPAFAEASKALAANQGLYNGFLSAGLLWGLFLCLTQRSALGQPIELFFLGCVVVAGVYGAATVGKKILFVQALPAAVAIGAVLLAG